MWDPHDILKRALCLDLGYCGVIIDFCSWLHSSLQRAVKYEIPTDLFICVLVDCRQFAGQAQLHDFCWMLYFWDTDPVCGPEALQAPLSRVTVPGDTQHIPSPEIQHLLAGSCWCPHLLP